MNNDEILAFSYRRASEDPQFSPHVWLNDAQVTYKSVLTRLYKLELSDMTDSMYFVNYSRTVNKIDNDITLIRNTASEHTLLLKQRQLHNAISELAKVEIKLIQNRNEIERLEHVKRKLAQDINVVRGLISDRTNWRGN